MSVLTVSFTPRSWAHLGTDELLDLAHRFDATSVAALAFDDPDADGGHGAARWDSSTAIGAAIAVTERIGFVLPIASSYTEPFTAARRVGSLDHLSAGRTGWLVDPRRSEARDRRTRSVAPDLGLHDPIGRAAELIEVARALWDSWDTDALRFDVDGNVMVDLARVHPLNFAGRHFRVAGPINLCRPPSGNPPLFVRATDERTAGLAGSAADVALVRDPQRVGTIIDSADAAGRSEPPLVLWSLDASDPSIDQPLPHGVDGIDVVAREPGDVAAIAALVDTASSSAPRTLRAALALTPLRS